MNEYWEMECSGCDQRLRLTVTEKNQGKTVVATCPKCKSKTTTTIGTLPPPIKEEIPEEISDALLQLQELIENNKKIGEIVQSMARKGFYTNFHAIVFWDQSQTSRSSLKLRVGSDGKIVPGTFDRKDQEFMREFNIKL